MEEEIKKKGKFKKGCLGCLGVIVVIILSVERFIPLIRGSLYFLPTTYGRVIDKETNKPIRYVLLKTFTTGGDEVRVLSSEEGEYRFPRRLTGRVWKSGGFGGIGIIEYCPGAKTTLIARFPGYKKYEIDMKKNRISQKIDIYLERPKTAEEAVEGLISYYDKFPSEVYELYKETSFKEAINIINKYPKTEWADKAYGCIWGPLSEWKINCENLKSEKIRKECFEQKKKWESRHK